jgi:hypothetical protein
VTGPGADADLPRPRGRRRRLARATVGGAVLAGAVVGVVVVASDGGSSARAPVAAPADPAAKVVVELPVDADQEVFLRPDAPEADIGGIRAALLADPRVAALRYLDHEGAYARFVDVMEDQNPALVKFTTPESLPTSFLVLLIRDADEQAFVADYRGQPSVAEVIDPATKAIRR